MMTSSKSQVTQGTILIFLEVLMVGKILTKFELNWTSTSRENQGGGGVILPPPPPRSDRADPKIKVEIGLTITTNQSQIPKRYAAFEINRKRANKSRNIDPLRQLVNKLKQDGQRKSLSMSDIIIENGNYNVSLIKELSVRILQTFGAPKIKTISRLLTLILRLSY